MLGNVVHSECSTRFRGRWDVCARAILMAVDIAKEESLHSRREIPAMDMHLCLPSSIYQSINEIIFCIACCFCCFYFSDIYSSTSFYRSIHSTSTIHPSIPIPFQSKEVLPYHQPNIGVVAFSFIFIFSLYYGIFIMCVLVDHTQPSLSNHHPSSMKTLPM